jgi:His/Glu/Gln/Arg/opine family amino acid ABC transporter permease subunit
MNAGTLYWLGETAAAARVTIGIAVGAAALALLLGLVGAAAKIGAPAPMRWAVEFFATVLRGVPELLTILVTYYGTQIAINELAPVLGFASFDVDPFAAAIAALGLSTAAYATQTLEGAIRAVDRGQLDAARSLGLRRWTVFLLVTLPQAWRFALPGLGNLWLSLIKQTALVSVLSLNEIIFTARQAVEVTKEPFLFFAGACVVYLVLTKVSMTGYDAIYARTFRGLRRDGV